MDRNGGFTTQMTIISTTVGKNPLEEIKQPSQPIKESEMQYLGRCTRPFRKTPKKDVLFIIGTWNAKVGSQETPGVTGKYNFGVKMKQGKG